MLPDQWLLRSLVACCCLFTVSLQADVRIQDSLGEQIFAEKPAKVVALNWAVAEELVELGVKPVGMADKRGYQDWVVHPRLPSGIKDVGRRDEPSIELIAILQPDLIVIGTQQLGLKKKLEKVAPVVYFDNYRADHHNPSAVEASFLELARLLDREKVARERLSLRDQQLQKLRKRLQASYPKGLPEVAVVRFVDTAHVRVYGRNSMVKAATDALGLKPALPQPVTTWGQTQKTLTDLAAVGQGTLLYIEPFAQKAALQKMPLWQQLPFVRKGRVAAVQPVWTYGGPLSIEYIAKAITEALLELNS
jgi:iron complex transport system substrate-binding protein